jgi:hypothetical protein
MVQDTGESLIQAALPLRPTPLRSLPPPGRILFSHGCGTGLGDQFMCLPCVQVLRGTFPESNLTILTDYPDFWKARIDSGTTIVPRTADDAGSLGRLLEDDFDLVLCGYHPECVAACAEASVPIIFCYGTDLDHFRCFYSGDGALCEVPLPITRRSLVEADKFMALFSDLGIVESRGAFALPFEFTAGTPICARTIWEDRPRVLIHPCSREEQKEWPVEKWVVVGQSLASRGMDVTISAGSTPRELD